MHIEISPKEIYRRGGLLDEIMERCFDASMLVDKEYRIIHISESGARFTGVPQEELDGSFITDAPRRARFRQVLETGVAWPSQLTELFGRVSILTILPVMWEGELIAAFGMIVHRNLDDIKNILSILQGSGGQEALFASYDSVSRLAAAASPTDFVGESPVVRTLLQECARIAKTPYPVLITGETGTGKEIVAGIIHSMGTSVPFAPYVSINCSAIPEALLESELFGHVKGAFTGAISNKRGKFELAAGGSLLLDEIGDMAVGLQAKLLRVLECKEFEKVGGTSLLPLNARIIASTNCDIEEKCEVGAFRPDLYYRLSTFEIKIPPLRERAEDIPLLVEHFIRQENLMVAFSQGALAEMGAYPWPGNVRQLRSIVLRLGTMKYGGTVTAEDARRTLAGKTSAPSRPSVGEMRAQRAAAAIRRELERNNHNISKTARALGISRTTLYQRIRKYGMDVTKKDAEIIA